MHNSEYAEAIALGAAVASAVYSAMSERGALSDDEIASISAAVATRFHGEVHDGGKEEELRPADAAEGEVEQAYEQPMEDEDLSEDELDAVLQEEDIVDDDDDFFDDLIDDDDDSPTTDEEPPSAELPEVKSPNPPEKDADPFVSFPKMPDYSMFPGAVTLSGSNTAFYEDLAAVDVSDEGKPQDDKRFSGEAYDTAPATERSPEELSFPENVSEQEAAETDETDSSKLESFSEKFSIDVSDIKLPEFGHKDLDADMGEDVPTEEPKTPEPVISDEDITPEDYTYIPPAGQESENVAAPDTPTIDSFTDIESELMAELAEHKRSFDRFIQEHHRA